MVMNSTTIEGFSFGLTGARDLEFFARVEDGSCEGMVWV